MKLFVLTLWKNLEEVLIKIIKIGKKSIEYYINSMSIEYFYISLYENIFAEKEEQEIFLVETFIKT